MQVENINVGVSLAICSPKHLKIVSVILTWIIQNLIYLTHQFLVSIHMKYIQFKPLKQQEIVWLM